MKRLTRREQLQAFVNATVFRGATVVFRPFEGWILQWTYTDWMGDNLQQAVDYVRYMTS